MTDISKCSGVIDDKECEKKLDCFRHIAPSAEYMQAWLEPEMNKNGECKFYWDVKKLRK